MPSASELSAFTNDAHLKTSLENSLSPFFSCTSPHWQEATLDFLVSDRSRKIQNRRYLSPSVYIKNNSSHL